MNTTPLPDPRALTAFLAVVEHGSFRGAAQLLGIPKSTISQRVAQLEDQLGVQLLVRTTRNIRLTDVGSSYYADIAPAMDALKQANATVCAQLSSPCGHLRITAPFEFGQMFLADALTDFADKYPDVQMSIELTDRHVNLIEEGFDLALRIGPLQDSSLIARKVGLAQRVGMFASAKYLDKYGRPKTPRELENHRCLVMSGSQEPTLWSFQDGKKQIKMNVPVYMSANSFVLLAQLTRAGLGIARIPIHYIDCFDETTTPLEEVLPQFGPGALNCYAVYPARRFVSPALRALLQTLIDELIG